MRESTKPLAPRSRCFEAFDFRDGLVFEPSTGLFVARSGHRYSWSRSTNTLASVPATGGTYTAPATLPAFASGDNRLGLALGVNDVLRSNAAIGWFAPAWSGELSFLEQGARVGTAGGTLLALAGDDPTTGVRFYLDTTGSYYRFTYHNGTTSVSATLAAGQPTTGQLVTLRFMINAAGVLTLAQAINRGSETIATSSALATPSAFATGARVRIGRRGLTQNPAALLALSWHLGPGSTVFNQPEEIW